MRGRWTQLLVALVAILLACVATVAIVYISILKAHLDCGGTFGGYGGSTTDHLDRACFEHRQGDLIWLAAVVWIITIGGLVWGNWRIEHRRRGEHGHM